MKYVIPRRIRDRWKNLDERLQNLEIALDVMIKNPQYVPGDAVGFNGQMGRKEVFLELLHRIAFKSIVETGTFVGDTAAYLSQSSKLPVYTCEIAPRFLDLARRRVPADARIEFFLGNSRAFLSAMKEKLPVNEPLFFYLDAHWYEHLPLGDEIESIVAHWKNYVIMIDDFQVPNDDKYGFDPGISLSLIEDVIRARKIGVFFPARAAVRETGAKRGWVVLSNLGEMTSRLAEMSSLVRYEPGSRK